MRLLRFSPLVLSVLLLYLSYIVYMGESSFSPLSSTGESSFSELDVQKMTQSHFDLLGSCLESKENVQDVMIYSYTNCLNGFAAYLNEAQVAAMKGNPGVISVFENQERILHTTHSWEFLGFEAHGAPTPNSLQKKANFGEGVIIANLDTGVWPESKSFNDEGMGPVPSRWKGTCQAGGGFKCNKKLIGARYFNKGFASASPTPIPTEWNTARDTEGHGSHTLSTAGGSFVPGAEFLQDGMAIGSFHAIKKGIPVVASAGNNGPVAGSVAHGAPWLFTIGASTLDREFSATVTLGNKKFVKGSSAASKSLPAGKFYPLINAAEARLPTASSADAQLCQNGTLDPKKVAGKIIVCLRGINSRVVKGHEAELAGAVGMILANDEESGSELLSDPHVLPAAQLTFTDGQAVMEYIKSTKNPTASISPVHTDLGVVPNPVMAAFSSRGPSLIEPAILKPDVTAPGVDVIAAYTEAMGPSELPFDKRVPYKCPENASLAEFNYPSITVPGLNGPVTVTRRVKNVGAPGTYTVKVKAPPKVSVVVEPSSLEFKKAGEEKIFKVTFKPVVNGMPKDYTFGHLTWSDSNGHRVKSPLVVKHANGSCAIEMEGYFLVAYHLSTAGCSFVPGENVFGVGNETARIYEIRIQECRISTWCEITREHGNELLTYPQVLPAAHIDLTDGEAAIAVIISAKKPPASISPGNTDLGVNSNPAMAKFSSRRPNSIEPAILHETARICCKKAACIVLDLAGSERVDKSEAVGPFNLFL
ncbi:hypothetical protein POTOM_003521 [Populus tomentosa]|uniref:Subtilisin-like protease SBT5.3 n=1 Tax=Populus tomentosa TaxID=118781 RepID=A0A8X8DLP3_POPTO|nr:hypothetical protein POTOM_003521 [Populus tomentosa]